MEFYDRSLGREIDDRDATTGQRRPAVAFLRMTCGTAIEEMAVGNAEVVLAPGMARAALVNEVLRKLTRVIEKGLGT